MIRRRRGLRIAGVALMLAILGPGRPFVLTAMTDARDDAAVAREADATRAPGGGRWSVSVDLADEVSDDLTEQDVAPVSTSKRHALIVGINNARGGSPLPGSVADAKNMRKALLMYGFKDENIRVLVEAAATRDAILREIDALASRTPESGIAVFAVATHTRRSGGQNQLLTADGLRISAGELASRLGAVRSKMWVALPTCYAGGYALRGIVGPNRIATFASAADRESYQLGDAGSFLILNMVRRAMLEGQAPSSVEAAFHWAKNELERRSPSHVPTMSDGIEGELVLGRVRADLGPSSVGRSFAAPPARPAASAPAYEPLRRETVRETPEGAGETSGTSGSAGSSGSGGIGICGTFRARCDH